MLTDKAITMCLLEILKEYSDSAHEMTMKDMSTLWSKATQATDLVEDFTVGNDRILDMRLAKYDVIGSKAHIRMLESIGLLTSDELETLTEALDQILGEINAGEFILEDDVEDSH